MKKFLSVLVVLLLAFAFLGCGSKNKAVETQHVPSYYPEVIQRAVINAPADVLVGIGNARLGTLSLSRSTAQTRARAEISRQMETIIQDMIRDYQASSEADPAATLSFQESMTVSLSKSTLQGASIQAEDRDKEGYVWIVVYMGKTSVAQEISQAQAAARLAVPAMASFSAEDRMNAAFDRVNAQERR